MSVNVARYLTFAALALAACGKEDSAANDSTAAPSVRDRNDKYTVVELTTDTTKLTAKERQMLPLLIDAAKAMDGPFWYESFGDRDSLLAALTDPEMKRFAEINYGPWDRLDNDAAVLPGAWKKPEGANYYPRDLTKAEFDTVVAKGGAYADSLKSLYTFVRRDGTGRLYAVPFFQQFKAYNEMAAAKLRAAANLAEDPGLAKYLRLRADALLSDDYQPSDLAWMDMKNNTVDIVIGPIETYEDALYGYKAAHEAYVLVKDKDWSARLAKYVGQLPALQKGIPVPAELKRETPGTGSDLNAYDALYYAGQANSGGKTIAINLPNDEEVQLKKGTRRLQLKNAMRAKFDKILLPIAQELIAPDQLASVTFDAFFENVMFHEVAHGLGIKNTINHLGTVRTALKERYSALEEGKADILGLYMIRQLSAQGELAGEKIENNYVTFLASLFRSVRFGASDSHGRANIAAFNYLQSVGAFSRDSASGKYRVDFEKMRIGADSLSNKILTIQGHGDYAGATAMNDQLGKVGPALQADLDRLKKKNIPVDIVFKQ